MRLSIPPIANYNTNELVFITIRTDEMSTEELKRVTDCRGLLVKFCTVSSGVRFEPTLTR